MFQIIARDITERKEAEDATLRAENQLRIAMDLAKLVHWEYDVASDTYTFDDQFYKLYGSNEEKEGGRLMSSSDYASRFVPAEEVGVVAKEIRKCLSSTDPNYFGQLTHSIVKADGERRTINVRYGAIRDGTGRTIKLFGANLDITDFRRSEEALSRSQQMLQMVLDSVPQRIFWKDTGLNYIGCNRNAAIAVGLKEPKEMVGKSDYDIVQRDSADIFRADDRQVIESGTPKVNFEERLQLLDGDQRWLRTSKIPLLDADGNVVGVMGSYEDITEHKRREEALMASENRYRILVDGASEAIIVAQDGMLRFVNQATTELTGFSKQELISTPFQMFVHKDDRSLVMENYQKRTIGERAPSNYVFRLITKEGTVKWVQINAVAVDWEDRPASLTFLTDITERKRAEDALYSSKKSLGDIIDFLPDATFVVDNDDVVVAWNKAIERMTGVSKDDMVGQGDHAYTIPFYGVRRSQLLDLLTLDDEGIAKRYDYVTRIGDTLFAETYCNALDNGKGLHVWATATSIFDDKGNRIGAIESIRDITERKRDETALRAASDRLELAARAGGVGIWDFDVIKNELTWDEQMFRLYGIKEDRFTGVYEGWRACLLAEDMERAEKEIQMALRDEKEFNTAFRVRWPDGTVHHIRALAQVERDASGQPLHMIGTNWDITAQKQSEKALFEANRKLNLLSSITRHDINNQTVVLKGNIALLRIKHPELASDKYLEALEKTSSQICSMIGFTKEYEDIGVKEPTWHDVNELIGLSSHEIQPSSFKVVDDVPKGTMVYADPLIIKVFHNLVQNSVRHGGGITRIHFYLEEREGNKAIVCQDDGVGVSPETKSRLFSKGIGNDHGFGLSLSREILSITGICISEEGGPSTGAKFVLTIPENTIRMS